MRSFDETLSMVHKLNETLPENGIATLKKEQLEDVVSWLKLAKQHFRGKTGVTKTLSC